MEAANPIHQHNYHLSPEATRFQTSPASFIAITGLAGAAGWFYAGFFVTPRARFRSAILYLPTQLSEDGKSATPDRSPKTNTKQFSGPGKAETLVAWIRPRQRLMRTRGIDRDQSMISAAQSSYITDGRHLIFGAVVRETTAEGRVSGRSLGRVRTEGD